MHSGIFNFPSMLTALIALLSFAQAQVEDKCSEIPCPYDYDPVCAKPKTGKGPAVTLGNDCAVRVYACQTKTGKYFLIKK